MVEFGLFDLGLLHVCIWTMDGQEKKKKRKKEKKKKRKKTNGVGYAQLKSQGWLEYIDVLIDCMLNDWSAKPPTDNFLY